MYGMHWYPLIRNFLICVLDLLTKSHCILLFGADGELQLIGYEVVAVVHCA